MGNEGAKYLIKGKWIILNLLAIGKLLKLSRQQQNNNRGPWIQSSSLL